MSRDPGPVTWPDPGLLERGSAWWTRSTPKGCPDWATIYRLEAELGMESDHLGAPPRPPQPRGPDTTRWEKR